MSLIFYYSPMSTAVITECVLAELGVDHEVKQLNIQSGDTLKPEFLKINPNARVPAIVHDGTVIWESAAITMYLGEVFGVKEKLYPELSPKRGEAMKWIVWSNVTLAEAGGRMAALSPESGAGTTETKSLDWVPPEMRFEVAYEKAKADVLNCFKILEDALQEQGFMLGAYSLVDTHVQGIVGWICSMGVDLSLFPKMMSWLSHCGQRPALAKMQN
jgi:glutathione S-transferase